VLEGKGGGGFKLEKKTLKKKVSVELKGKNVVDRGPSLQGKDSERVVPRGGIKKPENRKGGVIVSL